MARPTNGMVAPTGQNVSSRAGGLGLKAEGGWPPTASGEFERCPQAARAREARPWMAWLAPGATEGCLRGVRISFARRKSKTAVSFETAVSGINAQQ